MHTRRNFRTTAIAAMLMPAALFASPMVEIDSMDVNLGNVMEGAATSIKHTFKLKNTGDSVLSIFNIRPG